MHIVNRLRAIFNFEKGEALPLALLIAQSVLLGVAKVFFDTASSAVFLANFPATYYLYAFVAYALVVPPVCAGFDRIVARFGFVKGAYACRFWLG